MNLYLLEVFYIKKLEVTNNPFIYYIKKNLKTKFKILIIDRIYKFNKYYLPLLKIVKTTYQNIIFYIIFDLFLSK